MKKIFLIIIYSLWYLIGYSQITSYKIEKTTPQARIMAPYDSLSNITRANLSSLAGQKVQVLPQNKNSSLDLDQGRTLYKGRPSNWSTKNTLVVNPDTRFTYYCSKFGTLDNEVFEIVGVDSIKSEYTDTKYFYLKVKNERYPSTHYLEVGMCSDGYLNDLHPFDLIILGYFEKLKERSKGKKFVNKYPDNHSLYGLSEVVFKLSDGKPLTAIPENHVWEVSDIAFVQTDNYTGISYILDSPSIKDVFCRLGTSDLQPYDEFVAEQKRTKDWENSMIRKYGRTNGNLIIQGKVKLGFSKEMCKEAWGEPERINKSTGSWGTHEQWIYGLGSYLYFENGKLTSIDN